MKRIILAVLIVAIVGVGIYFGGKFLYKEQSFEVFTTESQYTVQLFFGDEKSDPKHTVCDHVIPFKRTITSSEIGIPLKTLETLLQGPTNEEKSQGAYTLVPKYSKLLHFEIGDDETSVVIDYDFKRADKCTKTMIETQIENTLFQFDDLPPLKLNPARLISGA